MVVVYDFTILKDLPNLAEKSDFHFGSCRLHGYGIPLDSTSTSTF